MLQVGSAESQPELELCSLCCFLQAKDYSSDGKGEERGPLKRQRSAQEEGREKGIAEATPSYACNQDTLQFLQLIFQFTTQQLKRTLADSPTVALRIALSQRDEVETSAPKTESPNLT